MACRYCLRITYIFIMKRICNRDNSNIKKIKQYLIALDHLDMFPNTYMTYNFYATKTAHPREHRHSSYTAGSCLG